MKIKYKYIDIIIIYIVIFFKIKQKCSFHNNYYQQSGDKTLKVVFRAKQFSLHWNDMFHDCVLIKLQY